MAVLGAFFYTCEDCCLCCCFSGTLDLSFTIWFDLLIGLLCLGVGCSCCSFFFVSSRILLNGPSVLIIKMGAYRFSWRAVKSGWLSCPSSIYRNSRSSCYCSIASWCIWAFSWVVLLKNGALFCISRVILLTSSWMAPFVKLNLILSSQVCRDRNPPRVP